MYSERLLPGDAPLGEGFAFGTETNSPTSSKTSGHIDSQADYPAEKLVANFESLLNDVHYEEIMDLFGIGLLHWNRRKLIRREFRSLYIALWRLALIRSFPDRHGQIFHAFMEHDEERTRNRREQRDVAERSLQYVDKLREYGDTDFSEVSRHLLSLMEFDETRTKAKILRLALHVRKMYGYFFNNLM